MTNRVETKLGVDDHGQNTHQSRRSTKSQGKTPIGIISHVCLFMRVSHMTQCPQRGSLYMVLGIYHTANMGFRHEAVPPVERGY